MKLLRLIMAASPLAATMVYNAPVYAQSAAQNSYPASYFEEFQANTARDMINQVPGFALQGGRGEGRGFGQASQNILINGRRPSSKSSGAGEILSRIPANKVVRIEIKDGASLDIPGLAGQVADIITGGSNEISGSWNYAARFWEGTDPQIQDGAITVSGKRGDLSYVASFTSGEFKFTEDSTEFFADGNGRVFEDRTEDIFYRRTRPSVDINLSYSPANDHIANLNVTLSSANQNHGVDERFEALTSRGNTGQSSFRGGEDEIEYEIGVDYALPAGPGNLKVIGLHRYEDSRFGDIFRLNNEDSPTFTRIFNTDQIEGEYISRAEYSFATSEKHDWQLSVEGAFNYLDSEETYQDTVTTANLNTVRVEEERAEGNLTHNWTISDGIDIQSSIGAEYSRISVPTTNQPRRKFIRPKGFISGSYNTTDLYTWRAKLERSVEQLDFALFTDGVSLTDNFANSGNSMIVPPQSWDIGLELERKDRDILSGTLRAYITFIEDPIDRIRFLNGSEGPGNLDKAVEYGIEANATWLMSSIGIDGMRLELEGALSGSSIDDPITNSSRPINNADLWKWKVDIRYDLPNSPYAFGGTIKDDRRSPFLRLDQSLNGYYNRPESSIFVEHKSLLGMTVRLVASGLFNEKTVRPRLIYDGDRSGELIEIQNFERSRGRRISLELSDTF